MPGPKPPAVPLSEAERQELQSLVRARTTGQQLALRARIILLLAAGRNAPPVAQVLATTRRTVRLWRRHWLERCGQRVWERLQEAPRPGTPATVSAEQWCQILALACEPPECSGRPISHWTPREVADEAIKRGLVEPISPRHVGRFLKGGRPQAPSQSLRAQRGARGSGGGEAARGHRPLSPGSPLAGRRGARAVLR
jgi:putative transposase